MSVIKRVWIKISDSNWCERFPFLAVVKGWSRSSMYSWRIGIRSAIEIGAIHRSFLMICVYEYFSSCNVILVRITDAISRFKNQWVLLIINLTLSNVKPALSYILNQYLKFAWNINWIVSVAAFVYTQSIRACIVAAQAKVFISMAMKVHEAKLRRSTILMEYCISCWPECQVLILVSYRKLLLVGFRKIHATSLCRLLCRFVVSSPTNPGNTIIVISFKSLRDSW